MFRFQHQERKDFNPRSREGSDSRTQTAIPCELSFQSTLPRRERHVLVQFLLLPLLFQSTLPRRERHFDFLSCSRILEFQSTLPRRERLIAPILHRNRYNFNPRSREGSDEGGLLMTVDHLNFNPRSREGSDLLLPQAHVVKDISIHAPAKGATLTP